MTALFALLTQQYKTKECLHLMRDLSPPFYYFWMTNDLKRWQVQTNGSKQGVLLYSLYMYTIYCIGWEWLSDTCCCRGNPKKWEKGLQCNNCKSWWSSSTFIQHIHSSLKLQLDCGPWSSATYKESLSHKPTQAEESRGEGGEEQATQWLSKQVSVYQQRNTHTSWRHGTRLSIQLSEILPGCCRVKPLCSRPWPLTSLWRSKRGTFLTCWIWLIGEWYIPNISITFTEIKWPKMPVIYILT